MMMTILLVLVVIGVWWPLLSTGYAKLRPVPLKADAADVRVHHFQVADDDLLEHARNATAYWKSREQSGEFKRHQVYAALMKIHPDRSHRDIARAIEAALWP